MSMADPRFIVAQIGARHAAHAPLPDVQPRGAPAPGTWTALDPTEGRT
jgi:hypothetical protein